MDVRVGLWRRLSAKELMLLYCGVGEDSLRVPWTARRSNQSILKEIPFWRRSWDFFGSNDAKAETPVLWPPHGKSWLIGQDSDAGRDWGQEEKGKTEDEMRKTDTRWMWDWVNSGSWWWTGRPGVLRFMGSQRVGHDWATELNWTELNWTSHKKYAFVFFNYKQFARCFLKEFYVLKNCIKYSIF